MRPSTLILIAAMIAGSPAIAAAPPADVAAQIASAERSPANVKLDESRKPAEVLRFFGLARGMHVLDLFGGNRYWAEMVAPAVGPKGSVTVWQPKSSFSDKTKAEFAAFTTRQPNAAIISSPLGTPAFGHDRYDFAIFNLNYHDLYVDHSSHGIARVEPRVWLKRLYAAMKPGGIVGVIDHVAKPNDDTRATANAFHRIDPAVLKSDFKSAGFVLAGTSNLLRNPADNHTLKVFDPAIRGKTDRAVFRFRKPV